MANANRRHMGSGAQGKGAGVGAMTDVELNKVPDAGVLTNRDKSIHPEGRGLDGKAIQTDDLQDHAMNRIDDAKV
jgi:hypothetical protein